VSTPLSHLGLDDDADERSVKRAYAKRLREVRPDVDPAGFQHLNELYRCALEWVHQRDAAASSAPAAPYRISAFRFDSGAGMDGASVAIEPAPAPVSFAAHDAAVTRVSWTSAPDEDAEPRRPAEPVEIGWDSAAEPAAPRMPASADVRVAPIAFDFGAFFRDLVQRAALGDADALRDWLHAQPPLWSLDVKAGTARALMPALYEAAPPMPDRCLDAILAFFDLDHVLSGQNALQLGLLRRRLHVEWLLRQRDHRQLDFELSQALPPINTGAARLFAMMSGPFRWFDVLWKALPPHRPSEAAGFLAWLESAKVESLPPQFDRQRIAFWWRAGNRSRVSGPRIAVVAARLLLILLPCALLDALALASDVPPIATQLLAYVAAGCAAYYPWMGLVQWQGTAQTDDVPGAAAWWRLGFIPVLAIATVALRWLIPLGLHEDDAQAAVNASIGLAGVALVLAFVRYRHRCGASTFGWLDRFGVWRIYVFLLFVNLTAVAVIRFASHAEIGAAMALGFWSLDLWRQRAHLRSSLLEAGGTVSRL
jgi:hypothetical protein